MRDWTVSHRLDRVIDWHHSQGKYYPEHWYDSLPDKEVNAIYDDYLKWASKQFVV